MSDKITDVTLAELKQFMVVTLVQAVSHLASKADLAAAIEPLASKADVAAAIEPLASKADLTAFATKSDLAAFATKDDLKAFASKADLSAAIKPLATRQDLGHTEGRLMRRMDKGFSDAMLGIGDAFNNVNDLRDKQYNGLLRRITKLKNV